VCVTPALTVATPAEKSGGTLAWPWLLMPQPAHVAEVCDVVVVLTELPLSARRGSIVVQDRAALEIEALKTED
jgi:hypothetical protein